MTDPLTSDEKLTRRCANCGEAFKPYDSHQRYCGNSRECEQAEAEEEREAYEQRREAAIQDGYGRY